MRIAERIASEYKLNGNEGWIAYLIHNFAGTIRCCRQCHNRFHPEIFQKNKETKEELLIKKSKIVLKHNVLEITEEKDKWIYIYKKKEECSNSQRNLTPKEQSQEM